MRPTHDRVSPRCPRRRRLLSHPPGPSRRRLRARGRERISGSRSRPGRATSPLGPGPASIWRSRRRPSRRIRSSGSARVSCAGCIGREGPLLEAEAGEKGSHRQLAVGPALKNFKPSDELGGEHRLTDGYRLAVLPAPNNRTVPLRSVGNHAPRAWGGRWPQTWRLKTVPAHPLQQSPRPTAPRKTRAHPRRTRTRASRARRRSGLGSGAGAGWARREPCSSEPWSWRSA